MYDDFGSLNIRNIKNLIKSNKYAGARKKVLVNK